MDLAIDLHDSNPQLFTSFVGTGLNDSSVATGIILPHSFVPVVLSSGTGA